MRAHRVGRAHPILARGFSHMTSVPNGGPTGPASTRKPTRFRVSIGGIAAIGALDTARTSSAQREVFFNIGMPQLMYFIFALSVAIIVGALVMRARIWRLGRPQPVFDHIGARLTQALTMGAATSRVKNDRLAGVMHWCIYSSFLMLTVVTILLALDDYLPLIFGSSSQHAFLTGGVYLGYKLFGNVFGIIGLVGIALAVYRRFIMKPAKLTWDRRDEDAVVAGLLGIV